LADANALVEGLDDLYADARSEASRLLQPDGVALHPGARAAYAAAGLPC
jgi:hypothetical protein